MHFFRVLIFLIGVHACRPEFSIMQSPVSDWYEPPRCYMCPGWVDLLIIPGSRAEGVRGRKCDLRDNGTLGARVPATTSTALVVQPPRGQAIRITPICGVLPQATAQRHAVLPLFVGFCLWPQPQRHAVPRASSLFVVLSMLLLARH